MKIPFRPRNRAQRSAGGMGEVEDSIFEYLKVPSDELAASAQDEAETNDNYDESQVLRECTFSDMAFHFSSRGS